MNNTALGAENKKEQTINFISEAHEKFYYEKLKEVRYQDVYHKALCYCLGISDDTRRNINSMRKLDTLVANFPDTYKLVKQDEVSKTYSFPKSFVSYRKPRAVSMEQREQARKKLD